MHVSNKKIVTFAKSVMMHKCAIDQQHDNEEDSVYSCHFACSRLFEGG